MTNNSSMNRISISNSTYGQISCVKYIPLLCWIWPLQTEKFLVLPTKSWNDTNTCSKFTNFLDDKIRTTVQLITYTVPQNCLSLSTIHHNSQFTFRFSSEAELQIFVLEGRHLNKIRLGANVTLIRLIDTYLLFVVEFIVILRLIRIQQLVYPLTLSFIPNMMLLKRFPHTHITLHFE